MLDVVFRITLEVRICQPNGPLQHQCNGQEKNEPFFSLQRTIWLQASANSPDLEQLIRNLE